ncbi:MAG: hypothetical protein AAGI38_10315 [Bacteroidota bacterium]
MKNFSPIPVLLILACCLALAACSQPKTEKATPKEGLTNPFFGVAPADTPQLLAPGILSASTTEYNGTFNPPGTEFYYTTEVGGKGYITFTKMGPNNQWTSPEIAPFSGTYSEYDPLFSPDGNRLYFTSRRPLPESEETGNAYIWYLDRQETGWSAPQPLFLTTKGDYHSSVTRTGTIYFNIWQTGDIYKATPSDTGYVVEALPDAINGRRDVGDPFISPDEDYLIFRGYFREGYGMGDLYISFNIEGEWTAPENLGPQINSSRHEMCPSVTPDGKLFVFSSNRLTDLPNNPSLEELNEKFTSHDNGLRNLYYQSAGFIQELKQKYTKENQ